MPAGLMNAMMPGFPDSDEINRLIDQWGSHLGALPQVLDLLHIIAEGPDRNINNHSMVIGGQATSAGGTATFTDQVPMGRRFIVRRVLTTAPATSGPLGIYAGPSAGADGSQLRHVVAAPQLAATDIEGGTVILGGEYITCQMLATPNGIVTVRLEGQMFDDGPRTSQTF